MASDVDQNPNLLKDALGGISALSPGERCVLSSLYGSSKAYLLALSFTKKPVTNLVALQSLEEAEDFVRDLKFFLPDDKVLFFPPTERLPFEVALTHPDLTAMRLRTLFKLVTGGPVIIITVASILAERLMPKKLLVSLAFSIKVGGEYPRDELMERLIDAGYTRLSMVEARGEVSVRGAIIDIFGPMRSNPIRIEFFDDEIESIREFDPFTQRSINDLDEVLILPASEIIASREARTLAKDGVIERADILDLDRSIWDPLLGALRVGQITPHMAPLMPLFYTETSAILDYLSDGALITLVEPVSIAEEIKANEAEVNSLSEKLEEEGKFFLAPDDLYLSSDELKERIEGFGVIELSGRALEDQAAIELNARGNLDITSALSSRRGEEPLRPLVNRIKEWLDRGISVYITAHNRGQAMRSNELLDGYGLSASISDGSVVLSNKKGQGLGLVTGILKTGFMLASAGIAIISEEEVFGRRVKHRAPSAGKIQNFLSELQDLSEGDGIVHSIHGIAYYRGLKRIEVDSIENDFLILEYRDGDKLYLPVQRMDQVSKFHGVEGRSFEPDKLGGPGWGKKKKRVKKVVQKIAAELLKLYAAREASQGIAFSKPDHLFREFEAGFEYEETPDQTTSIAEVLEDMQKSRPMDRLLCGDVGYGKTEVAMRAAFKAALDSKQVAVLVPTTVLAQQHAITFRERFAPYPVTIEVLSRFRSRKEQMETIERLTAGEVDILIGTHRMLGRDVVFKDLGLVVVDEEHRFGVRHKEKLRDMKKDVDVLTLTATPIPRTLQMSIADIRELSIISTPPVDRLAIKTTVTSFNETLIKDAIDREMRRGGQVFFVHNRVQSISNMEEMLARIVPNAKVAVAHGQMGEHELEKKMLDFINHSYDLLLCTTIIESGLDIPSANTIIINRADRFGLAELYQLRGRVGRSSHRAYAYLLCPGELMTVDARKRLDAIAALTEAGSGFRVASHDLEIRGAGELLGASQSGQIAEVGFDMYTKLLEEAVAELKGEDFIELPEVEVNLRLSAYIPDDYIPDARHRLGVYKKLSEVSGDEDLVLIMEELEDRYGELPELVYNLVKLSELRYTLRLIGAVELKQLGERLYLTFDSTSEASSTRAATRALELMKKDPTRYKLTPDGKFVHKMVANSSKAVAASSVEVSLPVDVVAGARYLLKEFE